MNVAVLGDRVSGYGKHETLVPALEAAAAAAEVAVEVGWIPSELLAPAPAAALAPYHAAVVAPQSAEYCRNPSALLKGLSFIRRTGTPGLAVCGGAQYALREFARHALGESTEVLRRVSCSNDCTAAGHDVSGTHPVRLKPGSRTGEAYGRADVAEPFACSYVLDPAALSALRPAGIRITGSSPAVGPTVFEWTDHPFYVATLFLPQLSGEQPHPLFRALLLAAAISAP